MYYFEDIVITFIEPCVADTKMIRFKAKIVGEISELFPYLNAVLPDAVYQKEVPSLVFKRDFRLITLYNDRLTVAKAINETDAYDTVEEVKNLIIKTYQDKENIEPMYEMRPRPSPLKIYTLLPKTNCKKCGEPTCLAFATKLVQGNQDLYNCTFIFEPERKDKLKELAEIVKVMGYFLDVEG